MRTEVSSGIVVFRGDQKNRSYLLLGRKENFLDFPKGHIEEGENEEQAAIRETLEESGIKATPMDGFRQEMEYWFTLKGEKIHKKVVMFCGPAPDDSKPVVSSEHTGFIWLTYPVAMEKLRFGNQKDLLRNVEDFLNGKTS